MRHLLIILGVAALSIAASAASAPLTLGQAVDLYNALTALDGHARPVKSGTNGQEQVILEPYRLSGTLRLAIGRDIAALKPIRDAYEHARQGIIMELSHGTGLLPKDTPDGQQSVARTEELLAQPAADRPLDLVPIRESDLGLDGPDANPIPGTVLAALAPLLTPKN